MLPAAARARNAILARDPRTTLSRRHLALQTIRALHRADTDTLGRALRERPALTRVLHVNHDTREITIHDDAGLQRLMAEAIHMGNKTDDAHGEGGPAPTGALSRKAARYTPRHKESHMRRWAGLWAPHRQRRWLTGVTVAHEPEGPDARTAVATGEHEVAQALADYWSTRFAAPRMDDRLAGAIARTFVPRLPTQPWPVPTLHDVGAALRLAKPTAVGPDGLAYTAWRFAGTVAWTVLHRLLLRMATTGRAPPKHNDAVGVFPPKGTEPGDAAAGQGLTRRPGDTRPLSLRNTDSKTVARLINTPLTQALAKWIPPQQWGFVAGRGAAEHVIMLDARA